MFKPHSDQIAVTFKDVAIYFSEEAWHLLEEWQKELYKIAMKEIHGALLSLGYTIANPNIVFRIKKEDEPCYQDDDRTRREHSSALNTSPPVLYPDIFLRIAQDEHYNVGGHTDSVKGLSTNNPTRESPNSNHDLILVVKQEEEPYFIDNHDLERKEMITDKTIHDALKNVKEKEMFEECHGNRILPAMPSSNHKESGFLFSDKQIGSRQMNYKVNLSNLSGHKPHKSTVVAQRLREPINPIFLNAYDTSGRQFPSHERDDSLIEKSNSALHQRIRIGPKPFHCDACGKSFLKSANLFRHRKIHTGDRPLKCAQCEKNFSTACSLIRHQWTHAGEIRYKCMDCEKSFGFLKQLQLHFHQTHVKRRINPSSEYDKAENMESLKLNCKAQTGERSYVYTDCKKSFNGGLGVIQHQVTHTHIAQHKCTYCGKIFQQRSNLTRHMRIHTGEKPYTCTECEKSFNQSSTLRSHQRCHTGEKPYSCPECGKCYSRLSYLSQHKKTHL